MDFNTVIGVVLAFILVLGAMSIGPGGVGVFIHIPSMIIVFGGTTAVTMLAFPLSDLKPVAKIIMVTAVRKAPTPTEEIDRIVEFANLARKEGLLALETKLQQVDDPFFSKGIQLVIDGFGAETVRDIMELEAQWEDARHSSGKKIMDQLGALRAGLRNDRHPGRPRADAAGPLGPQRDRAGDGDRPPHHALRGHGSEHGVPAHGRPSSRWSPRPTSSFAP